MKKLGMVVGCAALAGIGMLPSAVLAQSAVDWSGFYASVFGGYALDREAATGSSTGPGSLDLGGAVFTGTMSEADDRISGLFGGIAGGYNYQHDRLVFGIEASAGLGGFSKSSESTMDLSFVQGADTAEVYFDQRSVFDINWYTSLQGKVGLAHENWLFFLKGGAVLADASVTGTSQLTVSDPAGIAVGGNIDLPGASHVSQIVMGPAFGFGAEVMLADNVSASAEYSYVGLPQVTAPAPAGMFGGLFGAGGSPAFSAGMHQVKAGVSYHF